MGRGGEGRERWRSMEKQKCYKIATVRKGECGHVHCHVCTAHILSGFGKQHLFPYVTQTISALFGSFTGAVHVPGGRPCGPSGYWQDRDHQRPGQSPGLALCCDQLWGRHGLQGTAESGTRDAGGGTAAHTLRDTAGRREPREETATLSLRTHPCLRCQQRVEQRSQTERSLEPPRYSK